MTKDEVINSIINIKEVINRLILIAKELNIEWTEDDEIDWSSVDLNDLDNAFITLTWEKYHCGYYDGYSEDISLDLLWDNNYIEKIRVKQFEKTKIEKERLRLARIKSAEESLLEAERFAKVAQSLADSRVKKAKQVLRDLKKEV